MIRMDRETREEILRNVGDAKAKTPRQLDAIACQYAMTLKELAQLIDHNERLLAEAAAAEARRQAVAATAEEIVQNLASPAPPAPASKACSKCKKDQPLDEFHANSGTRDGKSSQCRTCNSTGRKPTVSRLVRTRARGRAMHLLAERHRAEFERLLEEQTVVAQAEHDRVAAAAAERGQVDAPVARLKSGPKRRNQTDAVERLDVARCPKCRRFHDAGHQVDTCEETAPDRQEAS